MQLFRKCFLLLLITGFYWTTGHTQDLIKNYQKEWKKVEELVRKNLPKSALTAVKNIYTLAKKDKQDAQIIKSLVYMAGLQSENRETNEALSIKELKRKLDK